MSVSVLLFFIFLIANLEKGKSCYAVRALTAYMDSCFSIAQESIIIFDHQMPFRALHGRQEKR